MSTEPLKAQASEAQACQWNALWEVIFRKLADQKASDEENKDQK